MCHIFAEFLILEPKSKILTLDVDPDLETVLSFIDIRLQTKMFPASGYFVDLYNYDQPLHRWNTDIK
jgi:hypothetical protein